MSESANDLQKRQLDFKIKSHANNNLKVFRTPQLINNKVDLEKKDTIDGKQFKNINFIGKMKNKLSVSQDENTFVIGSEDQGEMI